MYSYMSVSYLNIEKYDNYFKVYCIKPLDEITNRRSEFHCIGFSPLGNGKYASNISNGTSTLQDDFVINIYNKLLKKNRLKIKNN